MGKSNIEYCDMVWNPVTGCTPISAGCDNCWAQAYLKRFGQPTDVTLYNDRLDEPLKWEKPQTVFVCSHGDLFHEDVPFEFVYEIHKKMVLYDQLHTYLLLTKRPERARDYYAKCHDSPIPPHIWLGVSVEDQATADERIPILLQIPATKRWVSIEPMLGPVSFRWMTWNPPPHATHHLEVLKGLDYVVLGCESGPGRRPFEEEWVRDVKNECYELYVPFMYKQGIQNGKLVKLPLLDGARHTDRPEAGK